MTDNLSLNLEEIKAQIKLKSPTQQIRYISSLQIPEKEDDLIAFISFMRDGAMGNLSKFENVTNAYHRKYNEAFAKARNRKLSHNIENLEIKLSKSAILLRVILGIVAVILVVIVVVNVFSDHKNNSDSAQSLSDFSNITDISDFEKKVDEFNSQAKKLDDELAKMGTGTSGSKSYATASETDYVNYESGNALVKNMIAWLIPPVEALTSDDSDSNVIEETMESDQDSNLSSELLELEFSGTVANSDVTMQLSLDFEGNRAWGTYRYAKGAGEIVLMGDVNVTESDEFGVRYTATLYELDDTGNPYGTFELNGNHNEYFEELNGKYISVKGKESYVLLSNK